MKHLRLAAAAALAIAILGSTLAMAEEAQKATPATPAAKAAPATPAKPAGPSVLAGKNLAASDKAVAAIDAQIAAAKVDKAAAEWKTQLPPPKVTTFDSAHKYYVRMVTSEGPITIHMLPDVAPMHVTNFLYLTRLGFYDGIKFHRVITKFMAQGGCPLGTGTGGPGYQFDSELSPTVKHDRPGLLSMANAGPGTDGSQFFLTFVPTPWLNGKHTIYGEVVEGLDVLAKLESHGSGQGSTTKLMTIDKCTVEVR
jgi:peptidyl-prolyl cis-trans isomerase B (cyclophilin B)